MKIILASQSPRRKNLLNELGLNFEIVVSNCEEITDKIKPEELVMDLSLQKAKNVASRIKNSAIIIAADTIVFLDDKILGKPKDEDEAFQMLSNLQDNWHTVYTGVCIIKENGELKNYFEKADVHICKISDNQIWDYIKNVKPFDKAGAYAIQDEAFTFIDEVNGEIETVIGLPIKRLKQELNLN